LTSWAPYDLNGLLLAGLKRMNFLEPTPIQCDSLHAAIRAQKDIIGAAETGSGKTLAFGLPILNQLLQDKSAGVYKEGLHALILTPTRELALQVAKDLKDVAVYTDIKIACIVGGLSVQKQERILRKSVDVVIATPGRLWELMSGGKLFTDRDIKFLVLDEADRMISAGHFQEVYDIMRFIDEKSDVKPAEELQGSQEDQLDEEEEGEEEEEGLKEEGEEEEEGEEGEKEEEGLEEEGEEAGEEDEGEEVKEKMTKRQTFVFSATLTLRFDPNKYREAQKQNKKKKKNATSPLEQLLERVNFQRKIELVDLTTKREGENGEENEVKKEKLKYEMVFDYA